jgi:hypothetical protein
MRHMVIRTPMQTGYASIRHVAVSLPYVLPELVDGVKYLEPKDVPHLEGTELRRARAPSMSAVGPRGSLIRSSCRKLQRRSSRICWLCGVGLHTRALKSPSTYWLAREAPRFDDRYVSDLRRP